MLRRPGSALPIDSKVRRPMIIGFPIVIRLNRRKSSGRRHGRPPSAPTTLFAEAATIIETGVDKLVVESDCDCSLYVRMIFVIQHFKVLEAIIEDTVGPAPDGQPRQLQRFTRQLLLGLREMIQV